MHNKISFHIGKVAFLLAFLTSLLLGCVSKKPNHYGAYVQSGSSLIELTKYQGYPDTSQIPEIKKITDDRPLIVFYYPNVNINYLELRSGLGEGKSIAIDISPGDEDIYDLQPKTDLVQDGYCLVQGDPLGAPYNMPAWCFYIGEQSTETAVNQPTALAAPVGATIVQTATNQILIAQPVTYGSPGTFLEFSFPTTETLASAWSKCLGINKLGAAWKSASNIFLYLQSNEMNLDKQVLSLIGSNATLQKYETAGPALVSDLHNNSLISHGGVMLTLALDSPGSALRDETQEIIAKRLIDFVGDGYWLQSVDSQEMILLLTGDIDVEKVAMSLHRTGSLEIVSFPGDPPPVGDRIYSDNSNAGSENADIDIILTNKDFVGFKVESNSVRGGYMLVGILTDEGEKNLENFAATNMNKFLGITVDGSLLSNPQINGQPGKEIVLTYGVLEDLNDLLRILQNGALPDPLKITSSHIIQPIEIP